MNTIPGPFHALGHVLTWSSRAIAHSEACVVSGRGCSPPGLGLGLTPTLRPLRPAFPPGARDALPAHEHLEPKRKLYSAVPGRLFVVVRPYQPLVDGEIPLHRGDRVKGQCPPHCRALCMWASKALLLWGPLWEMWSPGCRVALMSTRDNDMCALSGKNGRGADEGIDGQSSFPLGEPESLREKWHWGRTCHRWDLGVRGCPVGWPSIL